jgi:hypothetical protein
LKSAIGLVKEAKDLLPADDQREKAIAMALDSARLEPARSVAIDFFAALGARRRAALIRERRLPRRQSQTISFNEHAVVFGLRPGKKADKHEGSAKHQTYQHHPTVRAFVVKIHDTHQKQQRRPNN